MKLPITENGVTLPKAWFGDATEVEVRQENGHVTVEASTPARKLTQPHVPDDPIWDWGTNPVDLSMTDASVNLDKYLYDDLGNHGP